MSNFISPNSNGFSLSSSVGLNRSSFISRSPSSTPIPSRPSSPSVEIPREPIANIDLNSVASFGDHWLPVSVLDSIIGKLGKSSKRVLRLVSKKLENDVGSSFLPTILSASSVEAFLQHESRWAPYITELIMPYEISIPSLMSHFSNIQKINFSTTNGHLFSQLTQQLVPKSLRSVSFQGTYKVAFHKDSPSLTEVIIWGNKDRKPIYTIEEEPSILEQNPEENSNTKPSITQNTHLSIPTSSAVKKSKKRLSSRNHVERKLIEDIILNMPELQTLEIWSGQHHPEVIARAEGRVGASLKKIRLLGGEMPCTFSFAVLHLLSSCAELEELLLTCKPMASEPKADGALVLKHNNIKTIQFKHSFSQQVRFVCPSLEELTLKNPQHHTISVHHCTSLKKLLIISSPQVASYLFSKLPVNLQTLRIVIVSGLSVQIDTLSSTHVRSSSMPSIVKASNKTSMGLEEVLTPSDSHDTLQSLRIEFSNSQGESRIKSVSRVKRFISLNLISTSLKKLDFRYNVDSTNSPPVREINIDCPNLKSLTLDFLPEAWAPHEFSLKTPILSSLTCTLHESILFSLFPDFNAFPELKKLCVVLHSEDSEAIASLLKPYMNWKLPKVEMLGISNFSVFPSFTFSGQYIQSLVLENMLTIPFNLMTNLDTFLPTLSHLELKAPDEFDYDALDAVLKSIQVQDPLKIQSSSLTSLIYTIELPYHVQLKCPKLEQLYYLQTHTESTLQVSQFLNGLPKIERCYIAVPFIDSVQSLASSTLRKFILAFGYGPSKQVEWGIAAPNLTKLKIHNILNQEEDIPIHFAYMATPRLSMLVGNGVNITVSTTHSIPANCIFNEDYESIEDENLSSYAHL